MLPLVWNKDNSAIVNSVLTAYYMKYIYVPEIDDEQFEANEDRLKRESSDALTVAANLVKLSLKTVNV